MPHERLKNLWLCNEGRIAILCKLLGCDAKSGCDLRKCVKMKKPLLSHHLGMLRDRGVVEERREGREKYYRIMPKKRALVRSLVKIVK
jgi:DNA-binding transcriptional ArsR family regulator